jgi:hypothetical protein
MGGGRDAAVKKATIHGWVGGVKGGGGGRILASKSNHGGDFVLSTLFQVLNYAGVAQSNHILSSHIQI